MNRRDEMKKDMDNVARTLIQNVCMKFHNAEYENGSMIYPISNVCSTEYRWQPSDLIRALFEYNSDYDIKGTTLDIVDIIRRKDVPITALTNIGTIITLTNPKNGYMCCGVIIDEDKLYYTILHIVKNNLVTMKLNKFTMVDENTDLRYKFIDMISVDWQQVKCDQWKKSLNAVKLKKE